MHHAAKVMAHPPVDQERVNEIGLHTTERSTKAREAAEALLADDALWAKLQEVDDSGERGAQAADA